MSSPPSRIKNDKTPDVPWRDVVSFVRQLSHDLRNHLNAAELQSTYLTELAKESEIKIEVQRLREMVSEIGVALQKLTAALGQLNPQMMSYRAADFIEDLRRKIASELPKESGSVEWNMRIGDEMLQIDPQLLQEAVIQLFFNACQHDRGEGALLFTAKTEADHFILELREPKEKFAFSTENWGREPLRQIRRGHYGLGLHRVRVIIEAHHGRLKAHYDSAASTLITTIALPLLKDAC
jgi:K+-sensing histidine kinase KdpD